MDLKKNESQLPSINCHKILTKEKGQIGWCLGLYFCLFLFLLLSVQLQMEQYQASSLYLEDALAASNLASAIIDIQEYGMSHQILLKDPRQSFDIFCKAVKENLGLNDQWECKNQWLITDKVSLVTYVVYNVEEDIVTCLSVNENGQVKETKGMKGNIMAPNGVLVEETGIYSEITYMTKGIFGIRVRAMKGKLVDISATKGETI